MPIDITMPRLSDTMEEGTLIKWRVQVGDDVSAGDHLADVETDKATMELQAFDDGKVAKLAVDEGQTVPVGELILTLAEEGESADDAAAKAGASGGASAGGGGKKAKAEKAEGGEDKGGGTATAEAPPKTEKPAPSGGDAGRIRVSPLARKIADEHGLDLSVITGSGPDGRIIKRDVLAAVEGGGEGKSAAKASSAAPTTAAPAPAGAAGLEAKSTKLSNMRKTIAKRLVQSKTTVPHFTVTTTIDMDPLIELRETLNQQLENQNIKLSVNDFLVRAAALACVQHPAVNSSWNETTIEQHGTVNVGVAVALPEERGGGLVVPVLRDVQHLGLRQISEQTRALAKKARDTGLSQEEMTGGTFTISNLGMFGVEHFEAIINTPEAAILATGAALEKPVVKDGQLVVGHEMSATLSGDHRVIDGAIAAAFLQTLKQMLENPAALLV